MFIWKHVYPVFVFPRTERWMFLRRFHLVEQDDNRALPGEFMLSWSSCSTCRQLYFYMIAYTYKKYYFIFGDCNSMVFFLIHWTTYHGIWLWQLQSVTNVILTLPVNFCCFNINKSFNLRDNPGIALHFKIIMCHFFAFTSCIKIV